MRYPRRAKALLLAAGIAAVALPALAQESLLPPGFGNDLAPLPPPEIAPSPAVPRAPPAPGTPTSPTRPRPDASAGEAAQTSSEAEVEAELAEIEPPLPPVEIPDESRRDPSMVGAIDPVQWGYGAAPWGSADGRFLSRLMRQQRTPLPSRWMHITLRNALLARAPAPGLVNPVDWAAERAWLLLRMGEADAARMIVSGVDVDNFTPKMTQIAVQSALANADPAGLCPLRESMRQVEPRVLPLTDAICASLEGEPASAASQFEQARRRGRIGGIDAVLAGKVVGAGANTARAVTVEWEPVQQLTAWRWGLAAATGMQPPERLLNAATPQLRAWAARAPMLSAEQRLPAARFATGLGVFSSGALVDLYSNIYDATDQSELSGTDALRLRNAFVGRGLKQRLDAMRTLWRANASNPVLREGDRAMLALAATRIRPNAELGDDGVELIAAMLAGGYDRQAARWAAAVAQMEDAQADRAWAMLALGTESSAVDVDDSRVDGFIKRDQSPNKSRSRLLLGGLVGTGRIDLPTAAQLSDRYGLGLGRTSSWTRAVDGAGRRGQAGSAVVLAAIGFQASRADNLPASHVYHGLAAMRAAGLGFQARMIAAELLART